jgi:ABC-type dipeptide/oligopeptide/nickel transport system permease component
MLPLLLRRLALLPATLLGLALFAFLIINLAPGDPVTIELRRMGVEYTDANIGELRQAYGLDKPLPIRFVVWLGQALTLDFGKSFTSGRPVADEMLRALCPTLCLALVAFVIALVLALAVGFAAALGGRLADFLSRALAVLLSAMPSYWLALLLLYVFSLRLGWTRVIGDGRFADILLPALTLSLLLGATYARIVHERIIQTLAEPHVRFARIKGMPRGRILCRHVLKNALLPIINLWGMGFGYLLGGSVVVETIFGWPGLGNLIIKAIGDRDFPMLQAYLVFAGATYLLVSFLADVSAILLDPRLRRGIERHGI